MTNTLKFFIFSVLLCVNACTCRPGSDRAAKEIYIGEYSSLTGSLASFGITNHLGIQLALKEANSRSATTGYKFKLITIDDEGDEKKAAEAVQKLISQNVVAIVGGVSSNLSIAGARIAQEAKVPMITPGSTHPKITATGDYIFRACFLDAFQGTVMAKFAFQDLKVSRVAILRDIKSEYSIGLADYFIEQFKILGGSIIADLSYRRGDLDFKNQLIKISQQKPDAIYIPGYYTEVALIARQAQQFGISTKFLGGDGWDSSQLYSIAEDAINGGFFTNHFAIENPEEKAKAFVNRFRQEFELVPDANSALAYDAANILLDAIFKAEAPTREKVRNMIAATKNFPGITGDVTFNSNRDPVKSAVIVRVDGKSNRFVTTVSP